LESVLHTHSNAKNPSDTFAFPTVQQALGPVSTELRRLETALFELLPLESSTSQSVAAHVFGTGGKRIRPALFFFCCKALGYEGEHFYPIAAVSEYVHTASLLHDDVVDNSSLRRNKPTSRTIWGDQASVLVGDLIYARASELMAKTGHLEIVTSFASAIRKMSEGELIQLENVFNAKITLENYLRIIEFKTATLLSATCRSAAVLAEANKEAREGLSAFGQNVGIAFQLIDDALDYLAEESEFGKKNLADLREGKVTYPLLAVRDRATEEEWNKISKLISSDMNSDLSPVVELIEKYDAIQVTLEFATKYTDLALTALNVLPKGPAKDLLENLARTLLWRSR